MSIGSKIYGTYMRRNEEVQRSRRRATPKRERKASGICPFTLEAISTCVVRNRRSRTACRYSLENCLAPR